MRVLLAHPPLNTAREISPPLGLCTLAAWLQRQGHEVRILDLDLEVKGRPEGQETYLRLLARSVREFCPQAVGVTSMYNNSLQAERMVRTIKEWDSSIATIAGGSHFGALGREALRRISELDYAVEGEGEEAFSALIAALEGGAPLTEVSRIHYRSDGELRSTPAAGLIDLAALPPIWPMLGGAIDLQRYADTVPPESPRRAIYIEAGRGCPFACTFCATAPFWERKYRVKPVKHIIEEMRFLYQHYGYNAFMLVHDLLTVDKEFIANFSDAMMESRLPVEWMANHRTDIDLHGLLPKMKTAGCWAMFFGIESASARLQKVMRKGLKREAVVSTITGLSNLGITSTCSFVIGFPDETPEELSATITMGAELRVMGAGMVQFHRLRTWPPARLSRAQLEAEFDLDSLRIEYPFLNVLAEDVKAIAADPEFFAGYFAPYSQAGTFVQLAQVEQFFNQVVSVAPLTIAALGRVLGPGLTRSFYDALSHRGSLTREGIEAHSSSVLLLWSLLRPYLDECLHRHPGLQDWQRDLVNAAMNYEEQRLRFVDGEGPTAAEIARSDNWVAYGSNVDIAAVFETIHAGKPLQPELVKECAVLLARVDTNSYRAYTTDMSHIGDLPIHPFLVDTPVF
jgi:radical SAM superfamily enzyme YgiQ (UPF0313 family)